ncbi:hypothetical protein GF420_14165 [candidate division GN15 bacterium]|nr:hypothetical protein [candidate division GN15 bacterium]
MHPLPYRLALLAALAFLTVPNVVDAQPSEADSAADTTVAVEPRFVLRLPHVTVEPGQMTDTVAVTLATHGAEIAGFDLKIGCDSRLVTIADVLRGAIPDSCRWEYFAARDVFQVGAETGPLSLWKVIALARSTPGGEKPTCFGLDREAGLVELVLNFNPKAYLEDTTVSLFFYWEDCRDNVLSDKSGSQGMISNRVFDYYGALTDSLADAFPSRTGTPRQCVDPARRNHARRLVDFHNGGISFPIMLAPDTIGAAEDRSGVTDSL